MTPDPSVSEALPDLPALAARLGVASPDERATLVRAFVAAHPGTVNLQGAMLEEADLQDIDLAGVDLHGAMLGEANLQGALLEDADLRDAGLRFANLRDAALEGANLQGADLWGVNLENADLTGADLTGVLLGEGILRGADLSRADLRSVDFGKADLTGARLTGADLRGATLSGTILRGAMLDDAQLGDVNLSTCDLTHVALGGATLEKTRFGASQLGGAIGEERGRRYDAAVKGYIALERNFTDLGDPDAARWAYGKKRRMQKLAARVQARTAMSEHRWGDALGLYSTYVGDQTVEWLCDYGESVPRVVGALVATYLVFTLMYGLTGSVVRTTDGVHAVTRDPLDMIVFSLASLTTQTALNMLPRSVTVQIFTGLETLVGIFLTGLLGFVAGNRIRR